MKDINEMTLPEAAQAYAKRNIPVFPLAPREKTPLISKADGGHGGKDATTDPEKIAEWWKKYPNANIGTATGRPGGLVMIDADADENEFGPEQFEGWQNNNGSFGETWRVTTGRGGFHLYLRTDLELHNVQQDQPDHLRDIDFRGVGGYAVLPPSVHPNGKKYQWDDEHGPNDIIEPAKDDDLLQQFHEELTPKKHGAQKTQGVQNVQNVPDALSNVPDSVKESIANLDVIEQGKRNGTLFSEACELQRRGWNDAAILGALLAINRSMCKPPLDDAEVEKLVNSALEYEKGGIAKKDEVPLPSFVPFEVAEYLNNDTFGIDIDYFRKYDDRKTGFLDIDEHLTLYPGLAALGGASSLGKTTFAINMADNLVKQGETVLYFSLEQEPIELVTKSLTRRLNEESIICREDTHLTNTKIKSGCTSDMLERVKREYAAEVAGKLYIVRGDFTTTAAHIREYIEQFISEHKVTPVVFVDYLQLISPPEGFRGDTRTATDLAIKTFKAMQTKNELLVILISNFNRAGYEVPVTFEAFKETGMIEYTCDYVWGLQLEILSHREFYLTPGSQGRDRLTTAQEKDDMVNEAINQYPKQVQFVSLKSRNGRQRYKCDFDYYMPFDYFHDGRIKVPFD